MTEDVLIDQKAATSSVPKNNFRAADLQITDSWSIQSDAIQEDVTSHYVLFVVRTKSTSTGKFECYITVNVDVDSRLRDLQMPFQINLEDANQNPLVTFQFYVNLQCGKFKFSDMRSFDPKIYDLIEYTGHHWQKFSAHRC